MFAYCVDRVGVTRLGTVKAGYDGDSAAVYIKGAQRQAQQKMWSKKKNDQHKAGQKEGIKLTN